MTEDATFEDLLERDKSRTIHDDNTPKLLVEIYKSIHYVSPPIMLNFFFFFFFLIYIEIGATFVVIIC